MCMNKDNIPTVVFPGLLFIATNLKDDIIIEEYYNQLTLALSTLLQKQLGTHANALSMHCFFCSLLEHFNETG